MDSYWIHCYGQYDALDPTDIYLDPILALDYPGLFDAKTFGEEGDEVEQPSTLPAGTTVSEDIKKTVFTELLKSYAKDVAGQKNSNVKMYAEIWRKLSLESQAKVQEGFKYFEINLLKDPCLLLSLVVKTHSTTVTGTPEMDRIAASDKLAAVRQGAKESLLGYVERIRDAALEARANDLTVSEQNLSIRFVNNMDNVTGISYRYRYIEL